MTGLELEPQRVAAFSGRALIKEVLYAERRQHQARHTRDDDVDWSADERTWREYRERLLDWRYLLLRGARVERLVACPFCPRIIQAHYNSRAECFDCGHHWVWRE